jgi:hypothetical protein
MCIYKKIQVSEIFYVNVYLTLFIIGFVDRLDKSLGNQLGKPLQCFIKLIVSKLQKKSYLVMG